MELDPDVLRQLAELLEQVRAALCPAGELPLPPPGT